MALFVVSVLLVMLDAGVGWARAGKRTVVDALHVVPNGSCFDRDELARVVTSWFESATVPSDVTVRLEASPGDPRRVVFEVVFGSEVVARRVFSPAPDACAQLHETVGLAVALSLRAALRDRESSASRGRREPAWYLGASMLSRGGVTTRLQPGAALAVRRRALVRLELELSVLAAGGPDVRVGPGKASLRMLAGQLSACARVPRGVRACGGARAAALFAGGSGYARDNRGVLTQLAALVAIAYQLALSDHWSLDVAATCVVPLGRTRLDVRDQAGGIVQALPVSRTVGEATVGPGYRF